MRHTIKIALLLGLQLCLSAVMAADALPNLSGTWVLDEDESDQPREIIAKNLERFDPSAARIINTRTGPVATGRFVRKPSERKVDGMYAFLNRVAPLEVITAINHEDPKLVLTYASGRTRTVYTDERDSAATLQSTAINRDQSLMFAAWENKMLVIETNTTSGIKVLESLSLYQEEDEPLKLLVDIYIESTRLGRPLQFRSIYTRPAMEAAASETP